MPLGRKKCFPKAYCCCTNYGSVYVSSRCQQKAAENNLVFMNRGTEGRCDHSSHILRRSYPVRQRERKRVQKMSEWAGAERRVAPYTEELNSFFFCFFSQLWEINGPKQEQDGERKWEGELLRAALHPVCAVIAFRAPFLLLSPLQPVTDDPAPVRRIWETVSRNTFTSGQTCPGPRPSPFTTSSPTFLLPSNLYVVQHRSHSSLGSWSLDFTRSPWSSTHFPLTSTPVPHSFCFILFFPSFFSWPVCDWLP